ncbi:MAG: DMT family transporter [Candidatus Delongbacteria bacterium]|nr:DMT family transporter [Candidatus Delongbacteria bacterium]
MKNNAIRMPSDWIIYALLTLAMFFWGLSFVWAKVVFAYYRPITVIFLRLVISTSLIVALESALRVSQPIHPGDLKKFCRLAFFQPFLYFLGESFGLYFVSSTIASIMVAVIPVVTPFFAFLFLKERLSLMGILGLVLSFIGVLLIVVNPDSLLQFSGLGIGLLMAAVISSIGYVIELRKLTFHYTPLTILKYQNLLGGFYFLPLFLIFDFTHFIRIKPSFELVVNMIYLIVFASILAFVFFNLAVQRFGINRSNIFTNTIPLFTALFSYWILDERLDIQSMLGILVVVGGVFLAQYKPGAGGCRNRTA